LGIDGGGTKTNAAIMSPDGQLLGQGTAGPSNIDDLGVEAAQANIAAAVAAARQSAALETAPFAAAFLGMAGVTSGQDRTKIRAIAHNLSLAPGDKTGVDHDCRSALAGGLSGRPGIVLIAGTGSSCYGRNARGESWLAGGRGHLISDEGSGYWLGVHAIRAAVMAYDGRRPYTPLLDEVLQALGIPHIDEVMHRLYIVGMSRAEIAALAPIVIRAAESGDPASQALIEQGASDMAECVEAVARKLGMDAGSTELALVGGLFRAGEITVGALERAVVARLPACSVLQAEQPPVVGACLLARQLTEVRSEK
jgi:N-acetylglucosamine kinase-like BadF-type ATPase